MIRKLFRRLFGGGEPHGEIGCREALARIHEFMDGELDPAEARDVAEHFEVCARCYPHLKLERGFRSRVQSALTKPEVPSDLRERVLEILEREGEEGDG